MTKCRKWMLAYLFLFAGGTVGFVLILRMHQGWRPFFALAFLITVYLIGHEIIMSKAEAVKSGIDDTLLCGHSRSCLETSHRHLKSGKLVSYALNVCSICPPDDPGREWPPCVACQAAVFMRERCSAWCADLAMEYESSANAHKLAGSHMLGYACQLASVSLRDCEKNIRGFPLHD